MEARGSRIEEGRSRAPGRPKLKKGVEKSAGSSLLAFGIDLPGNPSAGSAARIVRNYFCERLPVSFEQDWPFTNVPL